MKTFLLFLLVAGLGACAGGTVNRIGYGVPLANPVAVGCIGDALEGTAGIADVRREVGRIAFTVGKYQAVIDFVAANGEVSRYDLDIDGSHLAEETGTFYRQAHAFAKRIDSSILMSCGRNGVDGR